MIAAVFFGMPLPLLLVSLGVGIVGNASGYPMEFDDRQKPERLWH